MTWQVRDEFLWFKVKQIINDDEMQSGWEAYCTKVDDTIPNPKLEPEPVIEPEPIVETEVIPKKKPVFKGRKRK